MALAAAHRSERRAGGRLGRLHWAMQPLALSRPGGPGMNVTRTGLGLRVGARPRDHGIRVTVGHRPPCPRRRPMIRARAGPRRRPGWRPGRPMVTGRCQASSSSRHDYDHVMTRRMLFRQATGPGGSARRVCGDFRDGFNGKFDHHGHRPRHPSQPSRPVRLSDSDHSTPRRTS